MPGGENARQVLDRYLPVITQLRLRYLDDDAWHGDIVVVSHGAAIRLASAVLAGATAASCSTTIWPTRNPLCCPRSLTGAGAVCGNPDPAVLSRTRRAPGGGRAAVRRPDGLTVRSPARWPARRCSRSRRSRC